MSAGSTTVIASTPSRARIAVSAVFAVNGALAAMWVAHVPVIATRTGADHTTLGLLLLILGGSAFAGMQLCGVAIDRWGSRGPVVIAAAALCLVMIAPATVTSVWALALALAMFGFVNGALDVSMNAQAVVVEQRCPRPVMSSFHAFFSLGGMLGSGVAALGLVLGVPVPATVACVGLVCAVVIASTAAHLVRATRPVPAGETDDRAVAGFPRGLRRRIAVMAAVAFALMLAEGTAYDWSALHLVQRFGTSDAIGAIAFAVFSATMVISRFLVDGVVHRAGPAAVVRGGAVLAAVGLGLVILAPAPLIAIIGWAVFGIGIAGGVPQLFTAAGNITDRPSGRVISTVVGTGYLGMLAGPASIGFVSGHTGLGTALWIAVAALVFAASAAMVVRPRRTSAAPTTPRPHEAPSA
ncbi:MFS transporter [Williamsia sp. CHRR-6]|uniref:MFS transporter n=1 Tax=Williamsia sp. CHRR-6 TaxID=2835871 RepID=UPI001BDA8EF0|nr:MFS transporter [Williamsia sp. CHRR-6]MBT0568238.1 MFS transporter [Williamsia sp. CHRR-6]